MLCSMWYLLYESNSVIVASFVGAATVVTVPGYELITFSYLHFDFLRSAVARLIVHSGSPKQIP